MLDYYYKKITKRDLVQKFYYKNLKSIPNIQQIIINFGFKSTDLKTLSTGMLVLELITNKKGFLKKARSSSLALKIRKGQPAGCSTSLTKAKAHDFINKLNSEIFPFLQEFKEINIKPTHKTRAISITINQLIAFKNLEQQFYLFNNLPNLNVTIICNAQTHSEFLYYLKALKVPIKIIT